MSTTTDRILRLLYRLQQRDSEGQPLPATLAELRAPYLEEADEVAATQRLQRDLRRIGRVFPLGRATAQTAEPRARGRAPAELTLVWALLPGEALVL